MVEMRWVLRVVPAPEYGPDVGRTVQVLQHRNAITKDTVFYGLIPCGWTEWADVPTVEGD